MILLLLPLFAVVTFLGYALVVMWFFWALNDVGLIDQTLNFGDSCVVALPLWFLFALSAAWGSRN